MKFSFYVFFFWQQSQTAAHVPPWHPAAVPTHVHPRARVQGQDGSVDSAVLSSVQVRPEAGAPDYGPA